MLLKKMFEWIGFKRGMPVKKSGRARRYDCLFSLIKKNKCVNIMEIGVYNGNNSLKMIESGKKSAPAGAISYYGFDLFEEMDSSTFRKEVAKTPSSLKEIKSKLEKTGANIYLFKGNTLKTLQKNIHTLPKMDFIFIDGGHSLKTVENDWKYSKMLMNEKTIVVFDDYWNKEGSGCNNVIDSLDRKKYLVEILSPADYFEKKEGVLKINFVMVKIKSTLNQH